MRTVFSFSLIILRFPLFVLCDFFLLNVLIILLRKYTTMTSNSKPSPLKTSRLILNHFTLDDVIEVNTICSNKAIADTTAHVPHPYTKEFATEWIQAHDSCYREGKSVVYATRLRHTDDLIGSISLVIDRTCNRAELSYWIRKDAWNKGYCTEAGQAILHFGFEDLNLNKIYAEHMTRNVASGKVLEKLGLKKEGQLKQHFKKWGVYENIAVYGLCRCDIAHD